jgi:hypothetical protein
VIVEQNAQALGPHDTGAVFSFRIANESDRAVPFTGVTAHADPGLTVTVLGLTDCARGCVGTGLLDPATERQARASVDPARTAIPAGSDRSPRTLVVVLLVRVAAHPQAGTCAYVHSLALPGGPTVMATGGDWVAAVSTAKGGVPPAC